MKTHALINRFVDHLCHQSNSRKFRLGVYNSIAIALRVPTRPCSAKSVMALEANELGMLRGAAGIEELKFAHFRMERRSPRSRMKFANDCAKNDEFLVRSFGKLLAKEGIA